MNSYVDKLVAVMEMMTADRLLDERDGWFIYTRRDMTDEEEVEVLAWLKDTFGRKHTGLMFGKLRYLSNGGKWRFTKTKFLDRTSKIFYMREEVWTAFRLRWS